MLRTDLDHLPLAKRHELAEIVRILFAEFEDALAGRNAPHRKAGRILKVVLFGSYARGDWVVDAVGGYFSDYDILVVVNHDELADLSEYWTAAEDHLLREQAVAGRIRTPVNLIVHSLADINRQLRRGRPFFTDIARDGIALYEAPDHPLDPATPLSPAAAREEAREFWETWAPSAANFLTLAQQAHAASMPREAAFLLHQATERLYHCTLLVLTLYSPKSHKLNFLRSQAERLAPALIEAWPRDTRFAQRSFELLRRAYVDARYSPHYRISDEEIRWLTERIRLLQLIVDEVCRRWLELR
ncbi:HEPN domain-containing protein [Sphingomonas sp. 1P08PE]|uniref:HEPN domain-containing protein n=1 Tax=Sphingomonas sp. 1P08PE TaxID=554122 RepID=UPI0039A0514B